MAQNTELDELKQAMKKMEEENASFKEENASIKEENASFKHENASFKEENASIKEENASFKEENASFKEENASFKEENASIKEENASIKHEITSMKDTIQAMRSTMLAMLENSQQRQPEREVKATLMDTKYTNPKFLTDKEKKAINFEMLSEHCMENEKFNDLKPSRMLKFEIKQDKKSPVWPFITSKYGRFTTPTAGDYRFDVHGMTYFEDDSEKNKVDWYLAHIPKQFGAKKNNPQYDSDSSSEEEEEETEESLLKMSLYNENKRQLFLFSTDDEKKINRKSVSIECDRDIVFWIEAVVVEGVCQRYGNGVEFSGFLVR